MKHNAPSATANIVARNVLMIASMEKLTQLVPREAASLSGLFVEAFSERGHGFVKRSKERWFQSLWTINERITIPGLALHQALRKRHIERVVRSSLAEGFEQLVVLGGGLDSLAVRLHAEFPGASFIELDHPATQRIKAEVMERRRLQEQNLQLLPVDFTQHALDETLSTCPGYNRARRTVFICEGVLMYLEEREVNRLFELVRGQASVPVRFIFTFMEPDEKGRASFRNSTWLARLWLHLKGEPFKWGLRKESAEEYLRERGFVLKELITHERFRELYLRDYGLADAVLAEGENVCVCDSY